MVGRSAGFAWSGRGRITRVDVSTDGGTPWTEAELLDAALRPRRTVRFQHMWQWTGNESLLMSRAVDETGYVQPTLAQLRAARGPGTDYHFNSIRAWRVAPDGSGDVRGEHVIGAPVGTLVRRRSRLVLRGRVHASTRATTASATRIPSSSRIGHAARASGGRGASTSTFRRTAPASPRAAGRARAGRVGYAASCAACHGDNGEGNGRHIRS